MKRKIATVVLGGFLALATAGPVLAAQHGPPGPGNSHNGKCIGNPDTRLNSC